MDQRGHSYREENYGLEDEYFRSPGSATVDGEKLSFFMQGRNLFDYFLYDCKKVIPVAGKT